ncbi:tRNA dimethylallyltransferase isoform X2 [Nasonia vitripennis]|uniref:tRNA dimethylallyltransferase n=1 Tax=Nasonia vitripennis TaxID=7425 RepID=A0A7M7G557_NASVI|nr:tRNA dimethylallyltransferase isoform X2 [Nasonia vitripennis]
MAESQCQAECAIMSSRVQPILVILGATGTGKSKLGIELARRFRGEIISADSMQVYKGLDIITAKVTKEEQAQAQHHLLDVVDPLREFTVVEFRNRALPIIDRLVKSAKMPIIVGGTNYYIESLIWKVLVDNPNQGDFDSDEESPLKIRRIDGTSNEELHKKLMEVDPEMASRLHPNNRRKVIRSLEIFEQHGTTHSEILRQQRLAGGSALGGPLRHENSIILWLTCNRDVLDRRLDARVDSMLKADLVQELLDFHERYNKDRIQKNESADYSKGIFQSIGFKEFHNYLILPKQERDSETGQKLLKEAIENLKIATRRYARRQHKWVRNRLIRRVDRQVPPVYSLDCTDLEQWESEVYGKAVEIVAAVMSGETPRVKATNSSVDDTDAKVTDPSIETNHFCEVCQRVFIGEFQWTEHMTGAKHKRVLEKKRRLEKEQYLKELEKKSEAEAEIKKDAENGSETESEAKKDAEEVLQTKSEEKKDVQKVLEAESLTT